MRIGFIGAGKVGTAFGMYLKNKDVDVVGFYSRTYQSAMDAAKLVRCRAFENEKDMTDICNIIFITTNDDSITKACEKLVSEDALHKGQILVHMSGASSSQIMKSVKDKGCYIYSLHPLQSFAQVEKAILDLENTVFSLEGDWEKINVIEDILDKMGNKYFKLTSDQKSLYHATACVVSNYLVTLMDYGLSLFESIGIDRRKGYDALYPLVEGTIKNIKELGTKKALTGPIARADVDTIKGHIEAINSIIPQADEFYRVMGDMTLDLVKGDKIENQTRVNELRKIFEGSMLNE